MVIFDVNKSSQFFFVSPRTQDMCAAPGGKSLSILQRLNISDGGGGSLVCNEMSSDRRKRLKAVIKQYIPEKERTNVNITSRDGTTWHSVETDHYDKILVDAPCSSDRYACRTSRSPALSHTLASADMSSTILRK
jgi:16S rRNA C967 or C1407 C5-methylase (RsmB/RsmF family)